MRNSTERSEQWIMFIYLWVTFHTQSSINLQLPQQQINSTIMLEWSSMFRDEENVLGLNLSCRCILMIFSWDHSFHCYLVLRYWANSTSLNVPLLMIVVGCSLSNWSSSILTLKTESSLYCYVFFLSSERPRLKQDRLILSLVLNVVRICNNICSPSMRLYLATVSSTDFWVDVFHIRYRITLQ